MENKTHEHETHESTEHHVKPQQKDKYITIKLNIKSLSTQSIITFSLIAIIALSGFQTYQLLKIKNANAFVPKSNSSTQSVQATNSVDNLPDMVGGC